MSDENFQHELDDELLSAYLDGELTPEERAAVDARLARDPEAQHLLHQLRSVSQAVQMMPLESVGRDLREEIMRRTEAAKPTLGGGATGVPARGLVDAIPKVTIFQSRRSWIWASLALAAGLLIMVLQSADDKNAKLPNVAQHDRVAGDKRSPTELKEWVPLRDKERTTDDAIDSSKLAQDERTTPPVMAPAAAPTADTNLPQSQTLNKQLAAGESAPSRSLSLGRPEANGAAAPAITRGRPEVGGQLSDVSAANDGAKASVAAANSPAPPKVAFGGEVGAATASGKPSEAPAAPSGAAMPAGSRSEMGAFVVVHVVAKPKAIRDGAFDKLLLRNGVTVEPAQESDKFASAQNRGADKADKLSAVPNDGAGDVDLVIVDAPQETVASCLASLQKDEADYTGVAIEQRTAEMDRKDSTDQSRQEVVTDLSRYSRGIVSDDQKKLAANRQYFDRDLKNGESQEESGPKRELSTEVNGTQQQASEIPNDQQKVAQAENRGRARRVLLSDREGTSGATAFGGGGGRIVDEPSKLRRAVAKEKSSTSTPTDDMRVLFVISPDREPPAAGAAGEKASK